MDNSNVLEFKIPVMATIKETAKIVEALSKKLAVELGLEKIELGLTEYRIRELALTGQIVHIRAGNKILININKLNEFLNNGSSYIKSKEIITDEKYNTISKIEVRGNYV